MTTKLVKVWENISNDYDKHVTLSDNHLIRHFIKKEDEYLVNLIKKQNKKISIIEVGCGTGRVFFKILSQTYVNTKIRYAIGIDNAKSMIYISQQKLAQKSLSVKNKTRFYHLDDTELSKFFGGGTVHTSLLQKFFPSDLILGKTKYDDSRKIVCILLNTLGSIRKERDRVNALKNMIKCVGDGGMVIVSVFNGENFHENSRIVYNSLKPMMGSPKFFFNDIKHEFKTNNGYFSHWFERDEIKDVMYEAGCRELELKKIGNVAWFLIGRI